MASMSIRRVLGTTLLASAAVAAAAAPNEGGGSVEFLQWDGAHWRRVSDWIPTDQSLVRPMIEQSAARYAKEHGITPRACGQEG